MKIIEDKIAPNPRRVRIFLAEKGIGMAFEQLSIMKEDHRSADFAHLNLAQRIPVLVLDNGDIISESIAICRYFEALQPEPPLMGVSPQEIGYIEMWQRRIELLLLLPIANVLRHTNPAMAVLEQPQVGEWGEVNRPKVKWFLDILESELQGRAFIAGDVFTVSDITALVAIDFMRVIKMNLEDYANLQRWHENVSSRPSAKA